MFNILKYQHDSISDILDIRVVFQINVNGKIQSDGGTFTSKSSGNQWLYKCKRDYFCFKIENYLIHKQHIIDVAKGNKNLITKTNSMQLLQRFNQWYAFENPSLAEMCKWTIAMEQHFLNVLPGRLNPSYESSLQCINQIMHFAKQHVNGALINQ